MWDQLIPGLQSPKRRRRDLADMDLFYWTFHRDLEQGHEDAMNRTLDGLPAEKEQPLANGCLAALELLEGFWLGLDAPAKPTEPIF